MQLTAVTCPMCDTRFVVDQSLWRVGTTRVRCTRCEHYFAPEGSPHDLTVEQATNASVPITIWEPTDGGERG